MNEYDGWIKWSHPTSFQSGEGGGRVKLNSSYVEWVNEVA